MHKQVIIWATGFVFAALLAGGLAGAAQYIVGGLRLGDQIVPTDQKYLSYKCGRSDEYADSTECALQEKKKGPAGRYVVSSTIIHSAAGKTLFSSVHSGPLKLDRDALSQDINDLVQTIGAQPSLVQWSDEGEDAGDDHERTYVIATWGEVKVDQIGYQDLGQFAREGDLLDLIGNPQKSMDSGLPVFRMQRGSGYIYVGSFDENGRGDSYHVAIDADELAIRHFESVLSALLHKDQALSPNDLSLWPDVAVATRNLALDTSPAIANRTLDRVFDALRSSKLRSHVWAILPLGPILRLRNGKFWRYDVYGANTEYPQIRSAARTFITAEPSDKFVDFAYFLIGDFKGALAANPKSVISSPLHYALGFQIVQHLVREALAAAIARATRYTPPADLADLQWHLEGDTDTTNYNDSENSFSLNDSLYLLNRHPQFFDGKILADFLPDFAPLAAEARAHFAEVSDATSSSDDAAFMIGWLARQTNNLDDAVSTLARGVQFNDDHDVSDLIDDDRFDETLLDWVDYQGGVLKEAVRSVEALPLEKQVPTVESNKPFNSKTALWYVAARSAYRQFDYGRAIDAAESALSGFQFPNDRLPTSTDRDRIGTVIERIDPRRAEDLNFIELPYLLQASREISSYEKKLADIGTQDPKSLAKAARGLIVKYSLLIERPEGVKIKPGDIVPRHKDLRQALHLIDATLAHTQGNPAYAGLREWMDYRKVRILSAYDPLQVSQAIAAMQQEFPASKLLDDVLAEQIFTDGIMLGDIDAASNTFADLTTRFPNGNAVDNAYSWMEIMLACAGRTDEAHSINDQIIALFPGTRHAAFAIDRRTQSSPDTSVEICGKYLQPPEPAIEEEEDEGEEGTPGG